MHAAERTRKKGRRENKRENTNNEQRPARGDYTALDEATPLQCTSKCCVTHCLTHAPPPMDKTKKGTKQEQETQLSIKNEKKGQAEGGEREKGRRGGRTRKEDKKLKSRSER